MIKMKCIVSSVMLCLCGAAFGQSNPIEGGMTQTVTNSWNIQQVPWLMVGGNSGGNTLVVTAGGQVSNAVGYIGNTLSSSDNQVLVSGAGSLWNSASELSVGHLGASNLLSVTDGGKVTSTNLYIGNQSNGNQIMASGYGSLIETSVLNVGHQGADNILLLSGRSHAESSEGTVGYWVGADNNTATVRSNGSWFSSSELTVGEYGAGNRLLILDEGFVVAPVVNVGVQSIASNNVISVTGSMLDAKALYIGGSADGAGGISNLVEVGDGAGMYLESLTIYDGNRFDLNDGGQLRVGTNFNAGMSGFNWNEGGWLEVHGALSGMDDVLDGHRVLMLNGAPAQWTHAGSFYLGGRQAVTSDVVIVGMDNALLLENSASVAIGGDLESRNLSMMYIDPDSQITVGGNYYQDESSMLYFAAETNASGTVAGLLSVGGTAEFEEGATISYFSNVGQLRFDVIYTNMVVQANALIVGGVTNAQTADLEKLNAFGSLVRVNFEEENQNIYALIGRKKVVESAGLTAGTMLANVATEIDQMSLAGNPGADNLVELLNTISGSAQALQLQQNFAEAAPTPMHAQGLGGGLIEVRQRMRVAGPQGPGGPGGQYREAQDWMEVYGSWAEHNAVGSLPGYEHNVYGTVGGMDWVRGDLLMGVGLGYSYSTLSRTAGQSRANAGYGIGYLSLNRGAWFADLALAAGGGRVTDKASSAFGFQGKYDAGNGSVYLGGGREIGLFGGGLTFTPEASMQLGYYYQDRHRETTLGGLGRNVDSYDQFSAQSSVGATLALEKEVGNAVWQPELSVRWLHEYEPDADPLNYTIFGGLGTQYSAVVNSPEEDIIETGLGLSCTLQNNISLRFDVDWRRGDDYDAYTGSGRIVYRF
ncbi:MAG: autotransporter domain-containing protein [Pontiellaceae bacterium]|nr:autotransporter domain-containing protein [Pontiellaceae bacterium]